MEESHRREGGVIEYPENWEEMKKKYLEREDEKLKAALDRRKAESQQELEDLASKAITTRALRAVSEHKTLKDRTILRDAKSEEIQDMKRQLNEEINAIGRRIFENFGEDKVKTLENKVIGLKGRVVSRSKNEG